MVTKYIDFFSKTGAQNNQSWRGGNFGQGMQQCENSSPGVIVNSEEGVEYLGLCGEENYSNSSFIKKKIKEKPLELGVCDKDCGGDSVSTTQHFKDLNSERAGNGKQVSFFVKATERSKVLS